MALITFENLPSTNTPINAENLNNNFTECIPVSGSNTNGNYVKYPDGTMICWGTISSSVTGGHQTSSNGWYVSSVIEVTYPVEFYSAPSVVCNASRSSGDTNGIVMFTRSVTKSSFLAWSGLLASSSATGWVRTYVAVGRWKA